MALTLIADRPIVGAVHPSVPVIARACDALELTIREFSTPDQCRRLASQLQGVIDRLLVLQTVALETADALAVRE